MGVGVGGGGMGVGLLMVVKQNEPPANSDKLDGHLPV